MGERSFSQRGDEGLETVERGAGGSLKIGLCALCGKKWFGGGDFGDWKPGREESMRRRRKHHFIGLTPLPDPFTDPFIGSRVQRSRRSDFSRETLLDVLDAGVPGNCLAPSTYWATLAERLARSWNRLSCGVQNNQAYPPRPSVRQPVSSARKTKKNQIWALSVGANHVFFLKCALDRNKRS